MVLNKGMGAAMVLRKRWWLLFTWRRRWCWLKLGFRSNGFTPYATQISKNIVKLSS